MGGPSNEDGIRNVEQPSEPFQDATVGQSIEAPKLDVKEFPVGWGTFQEDLRRQDGFIHFIVVDDYTSCAIWDDLLYNGLPKLDSRPQGMDREEIASKPEGEYAVINAMHPMASDALWAKAGMTKPPFESLPAIYAVKHGNPIGHYIFNASLEDTIAFMQGELDSA